MDKFEMLLNELTSKSKKGTEEKYTENGSRVGEQREIVIRYAVGREEQAKVYMATPGEDGWKEDSYAMAFALGKLVGDHTGLDNAEISQDILKAVLKSLIGGTLSAIFKDMGDLLK